MKKVITIIGILFYSLPSFSQEYIPLLEDNKSWNVLSVEYLPGDPYYDTTYSTICYKLMGDTLLNSINYKKVYKSNEEYPINWSLDAFIREDDEHKVWLKEDADEDECLAYDFDNEVGDTLLVSYSGFIPLVVDSISFVEIDEIIRKKFWLTYIDKPAFKETWITGIGSNRNTLYSGSAMMTGGWYWFLCMKEDGSVVYENPDFESCYLITGLEPNYNNSTDFSIYPNPVKDYISMIIPTSLDSKSIEIDIYSISGKIVDRVEINTEVSSSEYIHSINNLESGIYFCHIKGEDISSIVKFVISH